MLCVFSYSLDETVGQGDSQTFDFLEGWMNQYCVGVHKSGGFIIFMKKHWESDTFRYTWSSLYFSCIIIIMKRFFQCTSLSLLRIRKFSYKLIIQPFKPLHNY